MAKEIVNIGTQPNDNTGDPLRDAFSKINDNFSEIYNGLGDGTDLGLTVTNDDNVEITNDLTVNGDLIVQGTTVTLNTETVQFEDNILLLNRASNDTQYNTTNAGIEVEVTGTTNQTFLYTYGDSRWDLSDSLNITGDLTVDTNTLYVDSTNNRVGVGTVSPSSLLEIQTASTSGTADFQIFSRGENPNYEVFKISRSAGNTELLANQNLTLSADYDNNHTAVDSNIILKTDNAERLRIDSSGVVQVRNQTPTIQLYNTDTALTLNQTLGDIDWYQSDPSDQGVGTVAKIRAVNVGSIAGYGELAFHTGSATSIDERLRIDYQGNVGIGTTSIRTGYKLDVQEATDNGVNIQAGNAGADIALSVGSASTADKVVVTAGGNLGVGTTSPSRIIHAKASVPAIRLEDSDVSGLYHEILGTATGEVQFKVDGGDVQADSDLVFVLDGSEKMRILSSGGLTFNGDTAAANALDDYEEGTWTPEFADAATGGTAASPATAQGSYVKIGSSVTIVCQLQNITNAALTGTNTAYVRNLPFTAKNLTGAMKFSATPRINIFSASSNNMQLTMELPDNTGYILFVESLTNSSNSVTATVSQFSGGTDIFFSMTYFAN